MSVAPYRRRGRGFGGVAKHPEDFEAATDYTVTGPDGSLAGWMRACFADASDHVLIAVPDDEGGPEWQMTGRQVASFRHLSDLATSVLFELDGARAA